MRWLFAIMLLVLLAGPLRPWLGRHWAFLLSVVAGAMFGLVLGAIAAGVAGGPAFLPLLWAAVGAIAGGQSGPTWLRHIEKDGKDDRSSRGH